MDISIVVPLYNEAESLQELEAWIVRVMHANQLTYEILFIDDGSRDNSWAIIEQLSAKNVRVRGIKFRRNYGKSAALNVGFQTARGDVVITMDADLQDSPDEIPGLYSMIVKDGYHLVSGWKQKRYDPISKTIPTKLFNWAARRMSGIYLHDFNCGLKAYRLEVVKTLEVQGEMHRWLPVLAKNNGFTNIGEKVVIHQARKYGTTKFGFERFINGFLDLITLYFVGRFARRPMHFFGFFGVACFVLGVLILFYLSYLKIINDVTHISDRPLFYFGILATVLGTQLFLAGFLGELIIRHSSKSDNYIIEKSI
ncbi:MAG: glycosyltransferase family 2 protein [Saprospiraceae bacterium]|nr:glycosyltransferase family 2 protein [Saprospiraceae bacterium]MBP7699215.1 glycosyltransferase family 2 protein [Saprospiraceae bacterium]